MSFASDLKTELARLDSGRPCCRVAELYALTLCLGSVQWDDQGLADLVYTCDSPGTARKIYILLRDLYNVKAAVKVRERKRFNKARTYLVNVPDLLPGDRLYADMDLDSPVWPPRIRNSRIPRNCCRRAFLRGIFLSRGYVNKPESGYHLEIILPDERMVEPLLKIMARAKVEMRHIERKNSPVLYLKDSEQISDFLRTVEASKAVMDFENARIVKYIRNTVNRQVNCETANVNKSIEASLRQNQLIERLVEKIGVDRLPEDLQDLALLRMEYPDDNLRELGQKMDPPLSKSGVAYRMRKLENYAGQVLVE